MTDLAPILQTFFTTRLTHQFGASDHTIASYRDSWRLLLEYVSDICGRRPSTLDISELVTGFLDDLETRRGNSISTRNTRLAAVHSLFTYAAWHHPEHADIHLGAGAPPGLPRQRPQKTGRRLEYLIGAPQLSVLAVEAFDLGMPITGHPAPVTIINLGAAHPPAQCFGRANSKLFGDFIAANCDPYSSVASNTIRTARSRNSFE